MVVVALALLGGLAIGWLGGGSLARLGGLRLRRPLLVLAAVVVQLAGALAPGSVPYALGLVASSLLCAAFLLSNRRVAGLGLVSLGFAANALAVLANGGAMPVSATALARVGAALAPGAGHVAATRVTSVRPLTDVLPAPLPLGLGQVLSPGDVLVASGCALLVAAGMRRSRHGQEGAQAPRTQEERRQPRQAA